MDLSTDYLGLRLASPLVVSACPLSENVDDVKRMEEYGAGAVVVFSLFEEQIQREVFDILSRFEETSYTHAEALTYFPEPSSFVLGPQEYLKHLERLKKEVSFPVIGSLNAHELGGWSKYARYIQEAGADALELNIYLLPASTAIDGRAVEAKMIDILRSVKKEVRIPVAVKMHPFFSSIPHMVASLADAGADGAVLFNRFYQPDIDLEQLEVVPNLTLSSPLEMRLPLRWIAILRPQVDISLAATTGIHDAPQVLKMLMVGADATMMASALLRHGLGHIKTVLADMREWLKDNGYESVREIKGIMSQARCPQPESYERANYVKVLRSFHQEI